MQVAITCRHGSIPEDVHQHIAERAEKLLNYFQRVTAINVTVIFEDDRVSTEIFVDAEHKHDFIARETGDEARGTFDRALQKMEQQIRKYKQKLQDHRRDRPVSELTGLPIEGGDEGTVEESSEP